MEKFNFVNKIIITTPSIDPIPISPISKRINPILFEEISNLNISGVYRIGSETDKRTCYIGSAYNITLKITHHLNLLYRNEHHSAKLQEWVNQNGLDNICVTVLKRTKSNPNDFENWEQYFLTLIKPKFNNVLNKRVIKYETSIVNTTTGYFNNAINEFGKLMVSRYSRTHTDTKVKFIDQNVNDRFKDWKPSIYIANDGEEVIRRTGNTNIKIKKTIEVKETVVYRKGVFGSIKK